MVFALHGAARPCSASGTTRVTVELPEAGGLYPSGNVTYRGTEVGRGRIACDLTDTGVDAVLSLNSGVEIPAGPRRPRCTACPRSASSTSRLLPRSGEARPLKNGDVIPVDRTSVPPDINSLLDADQPWSAGDSAATTSRPSSTRPTPPSADSAPSCARIVKGSTALAIDARKNLDSLITLIDQSKPVLDTQTDTSDSIQAWAANLATVTGQLQSQDAAWRASRQGPGAADEARAGRSAAADAADRAGQPGQPRRGRRHLPAEPRAAAGAAAAGHRDPAGRRCAKRNTKQDYKGDARLQPEPSLHLTCRPSPAAAVHHRIPAGAAAAGPPPRGLSRPARRATCTAGYPRTRRSTCAVRATSRA